MVQWFRLSAALLCGVGSLVAYFLFFTLYWPYRDFFNEEGRYLDESTLSVYDAQSGALLIPAVVLMFVSVLLVAIWQTKRPSVGSDSCDEKDHWRNLR